MPPREGKGKAAAAASAGDGERKSNSKGAWAANNQALIKEGFLAKVLEELGWSLHDVEGTGDCWAIATRAREMRKAGVDLKHPTAAEPAHSIHFPFGARVLIVAGHA